MEQENPNIAETCMRAGAASKFEKLEINGIPAFMYHKDLKIDLHKELLERPLRIEANRVLGDVESFIAYYNRFATEDSIIECDIDKAKFLATIDYHKISGQADNRDHKATYNCPLTEEWKNWKENDGREMSQVNFARFIEQNQKTIIDPVGADMLEMTKTLESNKTVNFKSGTRLDNGETQFVFEETISSKAGQSGKLKIPQQITIGVRLFQNGDAYKLDALFRYRITGEGQLTMWYELIESHVTHEAAVSDIIENVRGAMNTGLFLVAKL